MAQLSESESKMINLQYHMRQNNEDLKSFLSDLDNWEEEIKQIDSTLKSKKPSEDTKLPPVRNSLEKKKLKKKVKKRDGDKSKPSRISSYDYRSWDKFDVDKACESDGSSSDAEYETDEEWEVERKKQAAVLEKDKGNEYFKKGDYANAIECYSKGADLDQTNPLLPANRAMALLKQNKFGAAELDCSVALTLDPLYTKAYLRRASARMGLQKYTEAKADLEKALQLEPQNKKAKSDLDLIEKELTKTKLVSHSDVTVSPSVGVVKAISKPPSERSKKPLRRIEIEEVGLEGVDLRSAVAKTESTQSAAKRNIVEREGESFQRFTATSPADIVAMATRNMNEDKETSDNSKKTDNSSTNRVKICDVTKSDRDSTVGEASGTNSGIVTNSGTKTTKNSTEKSQTQKPSINVNGVSGTSNKVSPRECCVPVNSVQFQTDYRRLKTDQQAFYQYFKKIAPAEYVKLFGQFFDAEVLQTVLNIVKDFYIPNGDNYFECLQCLSSVKRFSMVVMFMSKKDKQVLTDIFAHLKQCGKHTESEVSSLASKYDLR